MKGYKLIKEYPGSPGLGTCIYGSQSEFYTIKPKLYPEIWQEFETDKCIQTDDGCLVQSGENIYYISDKRIIHDKVNDFFIKSGGYKYFGSITNAQNYLISQIEVDTDSGKVIGEDIKLYGCCLGHGNQFAETTSYAMWKRSIKYSDKWKWFKSEKERETYAEFNTPKYTKQDLLLFGLYLDPDTDGIVMCAHVNKWIDGRTNNIE